MRKGSAGASSGSRLAWAATGEATANDDEGQDDEDENAHGGVGGQNEMLPSILSVATLEAHFTADASGLLWFTHAEASFPSISLSPLY